MSLERLFNLCEESLVKKGLTGEVYKKRLVDELKEIGVQEQASYFLELHDKKVIYAENEHNLLVPFLLDIVASVDIKQEPNREYGDWPDVDVDFIPIVRKTIKEQWIYEHFGADKVCNIATYTTFGLRSSLIDMARVLGLDRNEIIKITTSLDVKDDEGEVLTWDKALELYDDLREYLEKHPELKEAAKKLLNRNRNMGQHASGVIIANTSIPEFIPLVVPKGATLPASAWVEGLHGTDLSAVGLVKFDMLSLECNAKVADTIRALSDDELADAVSDRFLPNTGERANPANHTFAIKMTEDLVGDRICALPGQRSWSDTRYLDDPEALAMANVGDLKMVFQFDGSPGIRKLAREGGVTRFDDLVAYAALYRPGPMKRFKFKGSDGKEQTMPSMADQYVKRKRGLEDYEIHPFLKPILEDTYGILVYQEQIARVLNVVGKIPLKDCETIRKAISKKQVEKFKDYKSAFVKNGQEALGWNEEDVINLFEQIEAFAGYGFNESVDENTLIPTIYSGSKIIKDFKSGDIVYSINESGNPTETEVVKLHNHGMLDGYEITFDDGYSIICTLNHKFLTDEGQTPLWKIIEDNLLVLCDPEMDEDVKKKKRWVCGEMRTERSNKGETISTPENMSKMQRTGLEKINRNTQFSVWYEIQNMEIERTTPKNLPIMLSNQTREHSSSYEETQRRQQSSREKIHIFSNSKENFSTTRDTESKSRTIEEMERKESRKDYGHSGIWASQSQEIKNGSLGKATTKLGECSDTLWSGKKTGRFCSQQYMDRGRWIFSFLQAEINKKKFEIRSSATTRPDVERGSELQRRCDADSHKYGMFCDIDRGDESRMVANIPSYAEISDTRRLVSRKIVRIVYMGKRQMYDIEVACPTHNFLLPTGIITSNSHSVAYTYNSSRGLYLKCHYPLQYCAAFLNSANTTGPKDYQKLMEYKQDIEKHDISVERLDLNKSKDKIKAIDGKLYWSFSKIKGIGDEVAKEIEKHQPYTGIEDFMERFGVEAKVLQPLIALGCFDGEPITLYKFYEAYKDYVGKKEDRRKRNEDMKNKYREQIKTARQNGDSDEVIRKLVKRATRNQNNFIAKESICPPPFSQDWSKVPLKDTKIEKFLLDKHLAEVEFYGFRWKHQLESCLGYQHATIENFMRYDGVGPLEILVKDVVQKKGKKVTYYSVLAEDGTGEQCGITIWSSDFGKFESNLQIGAMVRLRVKAPTPPFKNFTLVSPRGRDEVDNILYVLKPMEITQAIIRGLE